MKRLVRLYVLAACALFITSFWNRGFTLPESLGGFLLASFAVMVVFVVVMPLEKLLLFPLHIVTFGLFSFLVYLYIFHLLSSGLGLFHIGEWRFGGISLILFQLPSGQVSYLGNLLLSSLSVSVIINTLDRLT